MRRGTLLKGLAGAAVIPVAAGCGNSSSSTASEAYSLTWTPSPCRASTATGPPAEEEPVPCWDGGHAVNYDSPDLIEWISKLTGYSVA